MSCNKRIDVMTDIETLGRGLNTTVFQIGACAFNIETGEILDKFNRIADLSNEKNLDVDGSTLIWWLKTNSNLLRDLLCQGTEISLSQKNIFQLFDEWFNNLKYKYGNENVYLWGNGILFDNKLIQAKMEQYGMEYPVFYRNDRDMRTIVELAALKDGTRTEKEFREKYKSTEHIEHDGFEDAKEQIRILTKAWNMLC